MVRKFLDKDLSSTSLIAGHAPLDNANTWDVRYTEVVFHILENSPENRNIKLLNDLAALPGVPFGKTSANLRFLDEGV